MHDRPRKHGHLQPTEQKSREEETQPTFQTRTSRNAEGQSSTDSLRQGRFLCISQVSDYAEDLRPMADGLQDMLPTLIQNDTVNGKLVAIPYFTEVSLLYYRRDLLRKYHFPRPPVTWNELEHQAQTIQDGERAIGNKSFWGFLWQGAASEALTCNALEWQISQGGGPLIKPDGTLGIQHDRFVEALERPEMDQHNLTPGHHQPARGRFSSQLEARRRCLHAQLAVRLPGKHEP